MENQWHSEVPDQLEFSRQVQRWKSELGENVSLRSLSLDLYKRASISYFGYTNNWLGVPIIRLPEDLIRQQEIISSEKPDRIIEVGVARGGGLLFGCSIMDISGIEPRVLGIDNLIYPHTREAIETSRYRDRIRLVQADSTSRLALDESRSFLVGSRKAMLILDSNHTSDHVYGELEAYVPLLPKSSLILVCDTIIDELPPGSYPDRPWNDGKGPRDALARFATASNRLNLEEGVTSDLLLSEIRGGFARVSEST